MRRLKRMPSRGNKDKDIQAGGGLTQVKKCRQLGMLAAQVSREGGDRKLRNC